MGERFTSFRRLVWLNLCFLESRLTVVFLFDSSQPLLGILPTLIIWLAYLLPAHCMSGLYSYTNENDTGIFEYIGKCPLDDCQFRRFLIPISHISHAGYMLLYLTVLQMLTLFCTHFLMTRTGASIFLVLLMLVITGVGGYVIHIGEIPSYLWWSESLSPQRWLMPIVMADEFSQETLSNTAGQQLCRNKHVSTSEIEKWPEQMSIYVFIVSRNQVQRQEIIVQHPCPVPNGTKVLAEHWLLLENHILDANEPESFTLIALVISLVVLFLLTCFVFITNIRRLFQKRSLRRKS